MLRLRSVKTSLKPIAHHRLIHSTPTLQAKVDAPKVASVLSKLVTQTDRFKTYKPVTPGLRHLRRPLAPHLYEGRPIRLLTVAKRKTGGRNSQGKITVRHIGGGHRRRLRILDFARVESGPHDVARIEYDPGRSAHIALLKSRDPLSRSPISYILAPEGVRAGDVVESYRQGIPKGLVQGFDDHPRPSKKQLRAARKEAAERINAAKANPISALGVHSTLPYGASVSQTDPAAPQSVIDPAFLRAAAADAEASLSLGILRTLTLKTGNVLPLRLIPSGTIIHNVSLDPNGKGILCRSAGAFAQVVAHDDKGKYTQVRLQSGEVRNVLQNCVGTIGKVSNADWRLRSLGKAGRSRWLGRRPRVRGMAMNACDHPHGGGRGKSKGNKHPRSVWGWLTKGKRTRRPTDKDGNKMVVHQRPRGKEKSKGGRS
ncbi:hypothetical protein FRB96_009455 [Tulasnella sp. 330]|nr:hypothetical protein FRB96_009455 [Tulasnella sp. 330]KAG8876696.1 hypothetical protein FRB97_003991 [Tulasnella sp. 331]KAG8887356.1 hypothetical protein FRB98_009714 [Tulasnella sp. 332]